MKKKVVYALVAALSVSMFAGCGSKSEKKGHKVDIELNQVVENVVGAVEDVESFGINISAEIKGSEEISGEKMSVSGSASGNAIFDLSKEPAFSMDGKVKYSLNMAGQKMSGDYSAAAYGETKDEEMTVYVNFLDEWMKDTVDVSGYVEAFDEMKSGISELQDMFSEIDESDMEELKEFFDLEDKTKYVGNKECYVLSATLDANDIDSLEKFGVSPDELEGTEDLMVKYSMYLSKKTFFPTKFELNMKGKVDQDGTVVDIEKCNAVVSFQVNSVKVKNVPDEAIKNAEETDLGLDDMIGSSYYDDDDYYYENNYDDDYDDDYDDYISEEVSDNNYSFSEDGDYSKETIKLPKSAKFMGVEISSSVKAKELSKLGLELDEEYTDEEVEAGQTGTVCMDIPDTYCFVWMTVYNDTNNTLSWEECKIQGFDYDSESDNEKEYVLDNGIKIGGSVDDVIKLYGDVKPYSAYNDSYSSSVEYRDENYDSIEIDYDPETGIITGLNVDFAK